VFLGLGVSRRKRFKILEMLEEILDVRIVGLEGGEDLDKVAGEALNINAAIGLDGDFSNRGRIVTARYFHWMRFSPAC
jgi:hypothetical protein